MKLVFVFIVFSRKNETKNMNFYDFNERLNTFPFQFPVLIWVIGIYPIPFNPLRKVQARNTTQHLNLVRNHPHTCLELSANPNRVALTNGPAH